MGINFEFSAPVNIIFEKGSFKKVPVLASSMGKRVFVVTGKNKNLANKLKAQLKEVNVQSEVFGICTEPVIDDIEKGVQLAREIECDLVIGIGGGSAIDGAKAIAALVPNKGEVTAYLEIIGDGRKLTHKSLPFIAIPTTSGTGAEVTKNAVIKSVEKNVKVSLRSDSMYPVMAVIDPELTITLPPELTAITGIDALTHLLETFVSAFSNPFVDMLCREGMKRISVSLEKAYFDGNNIEARENMAMASMLGGMALANVKLGVVHGFAGPLGGMYPIPHGAACACLLAAALEVNIAALRERNLHQKLVKFGEVAQILTGDKSATAEDSTVWVKQIIKKLQIPSLSQYEVTSASFPQLIANAGNSSSIKGNPVILDNLQLHKILSLSM